MNREKIRKRLLPDFFVGKRAVLYFNLIRAQRIIKLHN